MKKIIPFLVFLLASCQEISYADTPPQVINKLCSANQFFSQIQPGPNNINCTQPTYSGIANTPSFINSVQISSNNVSLVNDASAPGNSEYYGTNSLGFKGFFQVPIIGTGTTNGLSITSQLLSLGLSSTSTTGALSSTDWNTFNNKAPSFSTGNLTDTGTDGIVVTGGTDAVVGSGTSLAQHVSDTSHSGYLSSTDWNTFNGKQSALTFGNLTDVGTDGITIGSGSGAVIGSGTTVSQHVADTTHAGYLSSTDWNTFNGKQSAGNYITALTGDGSASGPGSAALTLATVNSNVGSFGSASSVATFTANGKGLVTAAGSTSIQIAESQVTNLVSDLAGKQPTGNYITALTGDVSASGPGSAASTLASTISGAKTFSTSLTSPIFSSSTANPASAGAVRLANADAIEFRNAANSGNLLLQPGSSDAIPQYNLIDLVNLSTAQTLTNKSISGSSNTLTNIADGSLITSYLKADGSRALSGNWAAGAFSGTFNSVAVGSSANTISALRTIASDTSETFQTNGSTTAGSIDTSQKWTIGASGGSQVHQVNGKQATRFDSNSTSFVSSPVPHLLLDNEDSTASNFTGIYATDNGGTNYNAAIKFLTNDHTTHAGTLTLYANTGSGLSNFLNIVGSTGVLTLGVSGGTATHIINGNISFSDTTKSIVGTATNNNAAASYVGEYIESVISSTTSVPGSTGVWGNLTSISLTAGDWDVTGVTSLDNTNGATVAAVAAAISINSGNTTTDQIDGSNQVDSATPGALAVRSLVIPAYRQSLSGTTTIYLKMDATYTVATPQYRCRLSARRVR